MKVDLFSIGKFSVHTYGLMIAIGIILALVIAMKRADKKGLSGDKVFNMTILALIFGYCIGSKGLFILENLEQFKADPLSVLGSSGFVVYGGLCVGIITVLIYCKIKKLSILQYMDIMFPSVAIAQGIGRVGCFFAGCCYGKPTDAWWGITFPDGCFAPAGVPLAPTQLVSAIGMVVIGLVLIKISNSEFGKTPGRTTSMYLLLYGIGRFCVEFMRENTQGGFGPFTTAQMFSFVFIAVFIVLTVLIQYLQKKNNKGDEAVA